MNNPIYRWIPSIPFKNFSFFHFLKKREGHNVVSPSLPKKPAPQDIYQASSEWFYDMYQSQSVWIKRMMIALCLLTILLFLSLLANLLLVPLKEKIPYLYSFNKATGEITKLGKLEPEQISSDWAMARYFLTRYVMNREGYDYDNLEYSYQITWAMTDPKILSSYETETSSDNPNSPYSLYGKDKFITVNVISISRLNENTASVRFSKVLNDRQAETKKPIQKEAIVKWKYVSQETTQKMLDRNPLGFKVTYYQVTQINLDNN